MPAVAPLVALAAVALAVSARHGAKPYSGVHSHRVKPHNVLWAQAPLHTTAPPSPPAPRRTPGHSKGKSWVEHGHAAAVKQEKLRRKAAKQREKADRDARRRVDGHGHKKWFTMEPAVDDYKHEPAPMLRVSQYARGAASALAETMEGLPAASSARDVAAAHDGVAAAVAAAEHSARHSPGPTLDFFNAAVWPAISGWQHNDMWKCGTSVVCRWIADEQGRRTQTPYVLALGDRGFDGILPSTIGYLSFVTQLDLSDNNLRGTIPTEIALLHNLEHLVLSKNHFEGTIPPVLGRLTRLKTLDLSQNTLVGTIPASLGNLRGLSSLRLEYNELTGSVPRALGNLDQYYLAYFYLANNRLTGYLPTELLRVSADAHCWLGNDADARADDGNCFACSPTAERVKPFVEFRQRCAIECHDYCPSGLDESRV